MVGRTKHLMCSHDYVTVEAMTTLHAAEKFVADNGRITDPKNYVIASEYGTNKLLVDKACIKCGHCVDNLSQFRRKMKNMKPDQIKRIEKMVRSMYLAEAKRAAKDRERTFSARKIFSKWQKEHGHDG